MLKELYTNLDKVDCPVYIFSSRKDPVVSMKWSDKITKKFLKNDNNVTYVRGIEAGHKLTDLKIDFLAKFMEKDVFGL